MRHLRSGTIAAQAAAGRIYFEPVPAFPRRTEEDAQARTLMLRAIEELKSQAWTLSTPHAEHSAADYLRAAEIYEQIAKQYAALGDRGGEVSSAQHNVRRCRLKASGQ